MTCAVGYIKITARKFERKVIIRVVNEINDLQFRGLKNVPFSERVHRTVDNFFSYCFFCHLSLRCRPHEHHLDFLSVSLGFCICCYVRKKKKKKKKRVLRLIFPLCAWAVCQLFAASWTEKLLCLGISDLKCWSD